MNTLEPPPQPALPPLPQNRIPPDYRPKVRRYAAAHRGFFARSALRRVIAIELVAISAAVVADIRYEMPETWRWTILGTLGFIGIVLLALWWWRPALALGEKAVIRKLERLIPALGQRLRTSREAENATCDPGLAGVFASGLVADTRVRLSSVDLNALIPWKTIRFSLYACVAVMAAFVALLVKWPDFRIGTQRLFTPGAGLTYTTVALEDGPDSFKEHENPLIAAVVSGRPASETILFTREDGENWQSQKMDRADDHGRFTTLLAGRKDSFDYYVAAGDGHSDMRHMKCLLTPRIEKVDNEVRFPDYIGEPPKKSAGGDVKAVEGSTVTVTFQINPPLTDATAHMTDGRDLPLKISGSQVTLEQKVALGEVIYQLSGSDADGLDLPPSNFKITGFEDKPPEVELVEPKKDVEATTVWEILARLRAKDDFGLAEVGIVLVVGNEIKLIAHRDIAEKNVRAVSEMGTAALEDFPLTINDNLKIYAFARDHKPRDGARSVSRLVAIDIRQFQVRWRLNEGGKGGLPMSGAHLAEFFDLVKEQRKVVSDAFLLTENGVPTGGDLGAECDKIRTHEDDVAAHAVKLKEKVGEAGTMNADDLTLLDTAAQQMGEASGHLAAKLPRPAYKQADRALSSLLALRKKIMRLMSQSKSAMPSDAKESPKATGMSDLAAEAERLAQEEREVREKVTPQPPAAREMEVTRHQQEVAVTDAGELFAALVRHPGSSELALQRMEQAEKLMQKAEDQMKGAAAQEAGPGLKSAEDLLTALAAQLRALDEKNMEDTMGKLAQMAAEAKERMEKEQKEREKSQSKAKDGKNADQGSEGGGQPKTSDARRQKAGAKSDGEQTKGDAADKAGDHGKQDAQAKGEDSKGGANPKESGDQPKASDEQRGKAGAKNDGPQTKGDAADKAGDHGKQDAQAKGEDSKGGANPKESGDQPKASEEQRGKAGAKNDSPQAKGDAADKSGDRGKQDAQAKGEDSKEGANPKENGTVAGAHEKGDGKEPVANDKGDGKTGGQGENAIGKANEARQNGHGKTGHSKGVETDPKGFEKAAEDAATIDDALKALAGREGAGQDGERLKELREQAKTEALKPDIHALEGEKNDAAAAGKAGDLSHRFGKLSEGLSGEQRRLLQSHIEALTDLLARTRKLEQQANERGADGKNEKAGGKQKGADGKQQDAQARQRDAEGKQQGADAKQPGDAKEGNPPPKPADASDEKQAKEGNQGARSVGENASENGREPPVRDPQTGRNAGSKNLGHGGGSRGNAPLRTDRDPDPNEEFIKDLDRIADDRMRGLLAPLIEDEQKGGFEPSHLQPVAERLGKMLDELVRNNSGERHASGVPDEYSHLVDEYFRALSEDFRSDERTPPGQSSPRK